MVHGFSACAGDSSWFKVANLFCQNESGTFFKAYLIKGNKMNKLFIKILLAAVLGVILSGCASNSPVSGGLYTGVTHSGVSTGGTIDNNVKSLKTGTSSCTSILGMVAFGDCSEEAAKKKAGITKVNSVTHTSTSVYIFFSNYTTTVFGE